MSKLSDFFKNIQALVLPEKATNEELGIARLKTISMGSGTKVFRANEEGMWLGAKQYADAPFKVDMQGNAYASTLTLGGSGNSITGSLSVGTGVTINGSGSGSIAIGTGGKITIGSVIEILGTGSGSISVGSSLLIDGSNEQFSVTASGIKRVVMGKIASGIYGFEVKDSAGNILYNHTKIKMQHVFSNFMMVPGGFTEIDHPGIITYDSAYDLNQCHRLDFIKPSNFVITSAVLEIRVQDFLQPGTSSRASDIDIYLNPTKTKISGTYSDYYRFSGGNLIVNSFAPDRDEDSHTEILTSGEISAISNGHNYLIAQHGTDDGTKIGYVAMILVLTGYLS